MRRAVIEESGEYTLLIQQLTDLAQVDRQISIYAKTTAGRISVALGKYNISFDGLTLERSLFSAFF
jgi:hypothetical protein